MSKSKTIKDQEIKASPTPEINLGAKERKWSLIGGSALSLLGAKRRGLGGLGLLAFGGMLAYRGMSGHCPLYARLNMNKAQDEPSPPPTDYFDRGIHVEHSVVVNRSPEELFTIWRDFSNLPRFMRHLKSVDTLDATRSRWVAEGPAGWPVQWQAEIINEERPELIAWRSIAGADVDNAGSVRFIPGTGDGATEVRVVLDYIPPAGKFGFILAKVFDVDAESQIRDDLRQFKQLVESGEMTPTAEPQPV